MSSCGAFYGPLQGIAEIRRAQGRNYNFRVGHFGKFKLHSNVIRCARHSEASAVA